MLFSRLYKIIANTVTFVGFRGEIAPLAPLWIRPWLQARHYDRKPVYAPVVTRDSDYESHCIVYYLTAPRSSDLIFLS